MQRNIERLASAGEIFVELLLGLLQNVGCLYFEFSIHILGQPMLVALGARHLVPIAKA